jgi:hypothetical protein
VTWLGARTGTNWSGTGVRAYQGHRKRQRGGPVGVGRWLANGANANGANGANGAKKLEKREKCGIRGNRAPDGVSRDKACLNNSYNSGSAAVSAALVQGAP